MNPFTIPFSGANWIEVLLALGGGLVLLVYVYQIFWPKISETFFPKPDYAERAAELLRNYQEQKAGQDASDS
jgi:hypothetical protein